MKTLKGKIASSVVAFLVAGMTLSYIGCSSDKIPLSPGAAEDGVITSVSLSKKSNKGDKRRQLSNLERSRPGIALGSNVDRTVEEGSMTSHFVQGSGVAVYGGGEIVLPQGSKFVLGPNSLTPPSGLMGQSVTITMTIIKQTRNLLVFEFGPSGSHFEPAATAWFHYSGSNPKLFYINEQGTFVEQNPYEVDAENQWLVAKIGHFSRYAVAWAN